MTISIIQGTEWTNPIDMVKESIDKLGGISLFINSGSKVLIKPNLCWMKQPETGATTDPRVVEGILQLIKPLTDNIAIIESQVQGGIQPEHVCKLCGYYDLFDRYGVELINLSRSKKIPWEWATNQRPIYMPEILFQDYLIINVPKFKAHELCYFTCALKNLFGLIPDKYRMKYHQQLGDLVAELNKAFPSVLTVVDGLVGMEGPGSPTRGTPVPMNLIIAGQSSLEVDLVVSKMIGVNPLRVSYIRKMGLCECNVIGRVPKIRFNIPQKNLKMGLLKHLESSSIGAHLLNLYHRWVR